MKIVTLTLNPVLDKTTTVERLVAEQKMRCPNPILMPGGGGLNVSRGLKKLGGSSVALLPIGGSNGLILKKLVEKNGLEARFIEVKNETRESFLVTDQSTNAQYRFNSIGEPMSEHDADLFFLEIEAVHPQILIASGSLPTGLPTHFYEKLARFSKKIEAKFILDTSGEPLRQAADEGLFLLKPNLPELAALVGVETLELDEIDDAARQIIAHGKCEIVVVSLGPSGAMLVTRDFHELIPAPTVKKLSTVGAGDSMVAGMVWALSNGKNLQEMARWGVACGSAATMNPGAKLFKKEDAARLFDWLKKR